MHWVWMIFFSRMYKIPVEKIWSKNKTTSPCPLFKRRSLNYVPYFTYIRLRMDNWWRSWKLWTGECKLTLTSGTIYAHLLEENTEFSDWLKEERDDLIYVWKCNVHHFQPTKIDCSQFFKLKTDVATTYHSLRTAS